MGVETTHDNTTCVSCKLQVLVRDSRVICALTFWSLRDVISCRKSAAPLRSGSSKPRLAKNGMMSSRGPW